MTTASRVSIEEIAERIKRSQMLALVLPDAAGIEVMGPAAALVAGLTGLGKTAHMFAPPMPALPGLAPIDADVEEPVREFIISFDLTRSPIKELKYEREANRLNIVLLPKGARLRREDVEFRYGPLPYDLIITLGVRRPEEAEKSIARLPELLYEKPIVNIDVSPENTAYGELNLRLPTSQGPLPTLAEVTHQLLTNLNAPAPAPETASLLFAALSAATENFQPARTNADAFILAGTLIKAGAITAPQLSNPAPFDLEEEQIFGRALARSRLNPANRISWSILTAEDFSKTGVSVTAIPHIIEKLAGALGNPRVTVLLWHDAEAAAVCGAVATENADAEKRLATAAGFSRRDGYWIAVETFPSFAAAEAHIRQLLGGLDGLQ